MGGHIFWVGVGRAVVEIVHAAESGEGGLGLGGKGRGGVGLWLSGGWDGEATEGAVGVRQIIVGAIIAYNDKSDQLAGRAQVLLPPLSRDLVFPAATANIAIFGTQGSGKSTLLNETFATTFPVLDTTVGRGRCTKGVWLYSADSVNLIDTEGFDSVDRSEDERLFERQMALFCVAMADVVLVNLWLGEVGRHTGSHLDVLESILKVGERLVQPQTKKILFVVRDCGVEENRQLVEQTLTRSVNNLITANNNKNLKLTVGCYFLSHYFYEPERFRAEAAKLKAVVAVRKVSEFNCYRERDKYTFLKELWRRIKTEGEVDLKSINDAIRSHIVHRLREETLELLAKELGLYNGLTDTRGY